MAKINSLNVSSNPSIEIITKKDPVLDKYQRQHVLRGWPILKEAISEKILKSRVFSNEFWPQEINYLAKYIVPQDMISDLLDWLLKEVRDSLLPHDKTYSNIKNIENIWKYLWKLDIIWKNTWFDLENSKKLIEIFSDNYMDEPLRKAEIKYQTDKRNSTTVRWEHLLWYLLLKPETIIEYKDFLYNNQKQDLDYGLTSIINNLPISLNLTLDEDKKSLKALYEEEWLWEYLVKRSLEDKFLPDVKNDKEYAKFLIWKAVWDNPFMSKNEELIKKYKNWFQEDFPLWKELIQLKIEKTFLWRTDTRVFAESKEEIDALISTYEMYSKYSNDNVFSKFCSRINKNTLKDERIRKLLLDNIDSAELPNVSIDSINEFNWESAKEVKKFFSVLVKDWWINKDDINMFLWVLNLDNSLAELVNDALSSQNSRYDFYFWSIKNYWEPLKMFQEIASKLDIFHLLSDKSIIRLISYWLDDKNLLSSYGEPFKKRLSKVELDKYWADYKKITTGMLGVFDELGNLSKDTLKSFLIKKAIYIDKKYEELSNLIVKHWLISEAYDSIEVNDLVKIMPYLWTNILWKSDFTEKLFAAVIRNPKLLKNWETVELLKTTVLKDEPLKDQLVVLLESFSTGIDIDASILSKIENKDILAVFLENIPGKFLKKSPVGYLLELWTKVSGFNDENMENNFFDKFVWERRIGSFISKWNKVPSKWLTYPWLKRSSFKVPYNEIEFTTTPINKDILNLIDFSTLKSIEIVDICIKMISSLKTNSNWNWYIIRDILKIITDTDSANSKKNIDLFFKWIVKIWTVDKTVIKELLVWYFDNNKSDFEQFSGENRKKLHCILPDISTDDIIKLMNWSWIDIKMISSDTIVTPDMFRSATKVILSEFDYIPEFVKANWFEQYMARILTRSYTKIYWPVSENSDEVELLGKLLNSEMNAVLKLRIIEILSSSEKEFIDWTDWINEVQRKKAIDQKIKTIPITLFLIERAFLWLTDLNIKDEIEKVKASAKLREHVTSAIKYKILSPTINHNKIDAIKDYIKSIKEHFTSDIDNIDWMKSTIKMIIGLINSGGDQLWKWIIDTIIKDANNKWISRTEFYYKFLSPIFKSEWFTSMKIAMILGKLFDKEWVKELIIELKK